MPTIFCSQIIGKARVILTDANAVRHSDPELLGWLNDGAREIATIRKDASIAELVVSLVAGTRQSIPADGYALIEVVRNATIISAGPYGSLSEPGPAVRRVNLDLLNSTSPNWHISRQGRLVREYAYDERNPRVFYTVPPAAAGTAVELLYARPPLPASAVGSVIPIEDIYENPLLDYILFRAFSKETETELAGRAVAHRTAFENTLGLKATSDAAATPEEA